MGYVLIILQMLNNVRCAVIDLLVYLVLLFCMLNTKGNSESLFTFFHRYKFCKKMLTFEMLETFVVSIAKILKIFCFSNGCIFYLPFFYIPIVILYFFRIIYYLFVERCGNCYKIDLHVQYKFCKL